MLDQIVDKYRKLKENNAFNVLLHPKVVANYRLYQKEQEERPIIMKSHPVGIEIEMTNRCNLACIQCLRSLGLKPYKLGDMDFENYKKILAQFPYTMNLSLNGFGEPMMYKHFFEVVAYSRKQMPWCKIGIYSNGMLINEERANQLMDCGLTELNISIDAARPETYRKVRRGGKLDVLHNNIRTLTRVKRETGAKFPMIGLNYVMLNENEGELVEFVEQAADFGVDFVNCITYAGYDWGFKNKRDPESYKRELEQAAKRMEQLDVRCKSFPTDDLSWADPKRPFFCDFFWGNNFRVTYNGDITLGCCTPFKETYNYGNILETPFEQVWNNEFYRKNREMSKNNIAPNKTCASCDAFSKAFFQPQDENALGYVSLNALAANAK